jgi:hypothetical protein
MKYRIYADRCTTCSKVLTWADKMYSDSGECRDCRQTLRERMYERYAEFVRYNR